MRKATEPLPEPDARGGRRRALKLALGHAIGPLVGAGVVPVLVPVLAPALSLAPRSARAQHPLPTRPVAIVVPFGAGGVADLTARAVALGLAQTLQRPVIVENRPSAGSIVATQAVLAAPRDGAALLLISNAHAVSAGLFKRLPYDALRDLQPLGPMATFDLGLFVAAESRFASLAALLDWARANPGRLNIGTINAGSTQHLAARLFETAAGIRATVVPYKGTPAVLTALRAGEVDLAFEILAPWMPQVQGRTVRALALAGAQRHPALPEVPTVQQAGVGGYEVASWNALAVAAGTPAPIMESLSRALQEAMAQPAVQERLRALHVRPVSGTAEQARALLVQETQRWAVVIRSAGIEPE